MSFVTESKNGILLLLLKPAFNVFLLQWSRPPIHRKFCVFCRELTAILSSFGREKSKTLAVSYATNVYRHYSVTPDRREGNRLLRADRYQTILVGDMGTEGGNDLHGVVRQPRLDLERRPLEEPHVRRLAPTPPLCVMLPITVNWSTSWTMSPYWAASNSSARCMSWWLPAALPAAAAAATVVILPITKTTRIRMS